MREFCGFTKVPDASKITRFKQDFLDNLQTVFDNLVDMTEPICQAIDSEKADMTIFDSSGIEAFVTKNNPKYANRIIKLSSFISIGIFVMPINLALSQIELESFAISLFMIKISSMFMILKQARNPILLTKINLFMMQGCLFQR